MENDSRVLNLKKYFLHLLFMEQDYQSIDSNPGAGLGALIGIFSICFGIFNLAFIVPNLIYAY